MSRKPGTWKLLALSLLVSLGPWSLPARAGSEAEVARAREMIDRFDYEAAHKELASLDPEEPGVRLERARLALYEDRCDEALAELVAFGQSKRPSAAIPDAAEAGAPLGADAGAPDAVNARRDLEDGAAGEAAYLFDVVRACSRVTAGTILEKDEARGVYVRFQDEHDRVLFAPLADALDRAKRVLEAELGVKMPGPVRVLFVRDQLSLAITTGLPYEAAKKTGTLGVAKWGRVTMVTPRATHGYEWLDTVAHELTHLAITRATADRAPLWLQEGLAKREEQKWRDATPRDGKLSPESLTLYGIDRKLDLPLDKLGPSLAMLPSAEQAMVVYAEVQSFVNHLVAVGGPDFLPKLLKEIGVDGDVDKALERASGQNLGVWEKQFRAELAKATRKPLPPLFDSGKSMKSQRELAERVRLAELLFARGHFDEALAELARVEEDGALDPRYRYVRSKALESAGQPTDGLLALGNADDFWSNYGPYWALRARLETDQSGRDLARTEALRADPLGNESACGIPGNEPFCEAAAPSKAPGLGSD